MSSTFNDVAVGMVTKINLFKRNRRNGLPGTYQGH